MTTIGKFSINPVYAVMFGVLILALLLFGPDILPDPEPIFTPSTPLTQQTQEPSPPPTSTAPSLTPTDIIPPSLTPTPINTLVENDGGADNPEIEFDPPINTPSPTRTPTPTPTPTPMPISILGVVITQPPETLRVREEPGTCYRVVTHLASGTEINVFGRILDDDGEWLEIETPDGEMGYVSEQFVDISDDVDKLDIVNLEPRNCSRPLPSVPATPSPLIFKRDINIEGRAESAILGPFEEHWYTFFEEDPETVVIFMFKPNVNFVGDSFVGYNMEFFLHDDNQIPVWPPGNAETLKAEAIGVGSYPGVDRNGDLGDGELVWRGGPLVPVTRYYLRFVNRTDKTIEYCLIPGDVAEWICGSN